MVDDFERFGVRYWKTTEDERMDVLEALRDSWANTAAKLLMNWGKIITPVGQNWASIMQYVQVNPQCNQKCATACLNPMKRDTMFFDEKCLASCRCQF